jgi:hypothetical protein
MPRLAVVAAIAVLFLGCRSSGETRLLESKCDPALRQQMTNLARSGGSEVLSIFGRCSSPFDDQMRQQLSNAGAETQTTTGEIFTARVPSGRVVDVARLVFVTHLELSKTAYPSTPK